MDSDKLQGAFMLNPKDLQIAALEAKVAALSSQLDDCNKARK